MLTGAETQKRNEGRSHLAPEPLPTWLNIWDIHVTEEWGKADRDFIIARLAFTQLLFKTLVPL